MYTLAFLICFLIYMSTGGIVSAIIGLLLYGITIGILFLRREQITILLDQLYDQLLNAYFDSKESLYKYVMYSMLLGLVVKAAMLLVMVMEFPILSVLAGMLVIANVIVYHIIYQHLKAGIGGITNE